MLEPQAGRAFTHCIGMVIYLSNIHEKPAQHHRIIDPDHDYRCRDRGRDRHLFVVSVSLFPEEERPHGVHPGNVLADRVGCAV